MGKARHKKLSSKTAAYTAAYSPGSEKWKQILVPGIILLITAIVFYPAIGYQFKNWDDLDYISQNLLIRNLSAAGIVKIFSTPVLGMYNPLPFLVYAVEYKLCGLDPRLYNFSNILFHLLAVTALYRFIYRLSGKYQTAAIVALLFALHPMHVEAVCWASETKTSMFVLFYFLALDKYLDYLRSGYRLKYLFYIAGLFVLSALSKPEAVTLAPMLFLLDYYTGRKPDKKLFTEKAPFFIIALFFGVITLYTHAQADDSIFKINRNYSLLNNLLVSDYSVVFYIQKLFWPLGLSAIYPYPDNSPVLPLQYYLAIPVIPVLVWLIYQSGKFRKELIFGVMFFLISISVLLRLVPSGFFETANRYSYLAYTGLFYILGQYYVYIEENRFNYASTARKYLLFGLTIYIVFCCWLTVNRIKVWQDSVTLFTDVLNKQPNFAMAWDLRAVAKSNYGDYTGAVADDTRCIELDPTFLDAYNNRASFKWALKDYQGALNDCNKAIQINPRSPQAYLNKGCVMATLGKMREALADNDTCIQLSPRLALAYFNRSRIKISLSDEQGAEADKKRAIELGFTAPR